MLSVLHKPLHWYLLDISHHSRWSSNVRTEVLAHDMTRAYRIAHGYTSVSATSYEYYEVAEHAQCPS